MSVMKLNCFKQTLKAFTMSKIFLNYLVIDSLKILSIANSCIEQSLHHQTVMNQILLEIVSK